MNAVWNIPMSTTFSDTPLFPIAGPARIRATLHQSDSWSTIAMPWRVIRLWAARRGQRKALGELAEEQHLLDDIGLTRVQALREAAKPFWCS